MYLLKIREMVKNGQNSLFRGVLGLKKILNIFEK
jgi:hypothetical protein